MPGIQFEQENIGGRFLRNDALAKPKAPLFARILMKLHIAKNEHQVQIITLIIAVAFILIAIFLVWHSLSFATHKVRTVPVN
jgi:uncharacterized membrane protein